MSEHKQPSDAQVYMDGLYYKIGKFGMTFRWSDDLGGEWVRSTKTTEQVQKAIDAKVKRGELK